MSLALVEDLKRRLAAIGRDDVDLAALEQRRQGEDVAEVVVDDEHRRAGRRPVEEFGRAGTIRWPHLGGRSVARPPPAMGTTGEPWAVAPLVPICRMPLADSIGR